ncbi:MAG: Spo0E family sporulation regulatory protein-aspartic acid phosphatase [Bacillota bacterium]
MSHKDSLEEKRKQLIELYLQNNKNFLNSQVLKQSKKIDKSLVAELKKQLEEK